MEHLFVCYSDTIRKMFVLIIFYLINDKHKICIMLIFNFVSIEAVERSPEPPELIIFFAYPVFSRYIHDVIVYA